MKHRERNQVLKGAALGITALLAFILLCNFQSPVFQQQHLRTHQAPSQSLHVYDRVIYEIPSTPFITGTVFVAHACTHGAYDFWLRSAKCPHCVGLAEEVKIVQTALKAGYLVIAINSTNRVNRCWSGASEEAQFVAATISNIRQQHRILDLPLFALGTSSGASFVWGMACRGELDGVIVQVLSVPISQYQPADLPLPILPVVFNPMRRDEGTFLAMQKDKKNLQNIIPEKFVKLQECEPLQVTAVYLMDRLADLEYSVAQRIVDALTVSGHLDPQTGYLIIDPTSSKSNWREVIQSAFANIPMKKSLVLEVGKSPLAKTLNRAWAFHEYCATYLEMDLEWMQSLQQSRRTQTVAANH